MQGRGLCTCKSRAINVQGRELYMCKAEGYTRAKAEGYTRARQIAIHVQGRGPYTCKAEGHTRARQRAIHVQGREQYTCKDIHVQGRVKTFGIDYCYLSAPMYPFFSSITEPRTAAAQSTCQI